MILQPAQTVSYLLVPAATPTPATEVGSLTNTPALVPNPVP